jgi:DNA-binding transcriptional LysR family regulator
MRKAFLACLLALFCAFPARAQSDTDLSAIRATIERQVEAFRRHDGAAAFAFATDEIKAMFGSPERFMDMVRQGYGAIYAPRRFAFGDAQAEDGRVRQIVEFDGLDGDGIVALYDMERQPDGSFKIAGVYLVRRRPSV